MAKKRRGGRKKGGYKGGRKNSCGIPLLDLGLDLAGGFAMSAVADHMENKYHYRKKGVPNPYRATAIGIASGRLNSSAQLARLGAFLGVAGSFDVDKDEPYTRVSGGSRSSEALYGRHTPLKPGYSQSSEETWEHLSPLSAIDPIFYTIEAAYEGEQRRSNEYAWRLNCDEGYEYGLDPEIFETKAEYDEALEIERAARRLETDDSDEGDSGDGSLWGVAREAEEDCGDVSLLGCVRGAEEDFGDVGLLGCVRGAEEERREEALNGFIAELHAYADLQSGDVGIKLGRHTADDDMSPELAKLFERNEQIEAEGDERKDAGTAPVDPIFDTIVEPKKKDNRYAWRLNCEDGSKYGLSPEDFETREEYNEALNRKKREE